MLFLQTRVLRELKQGMFATIGRTLQRTRSKHQQMLDLRARAAGQSINLGGEQLVRYHHGDAYVSIDRLLSQ